MTTQTRYLLNEFDLPRYWYNINADMPVAPAPVLHPQTMEPVTPDFLVLFPMDLILQEISTERFIEIPEEVRERYISSTAQPPCCAPLYTGKSPGYHCSHLL